MLVLRPSVAWRKVYPCLTNPLQMVDLMIGNLASQILTTTIRLFEISPHSEGEAGRYAPLFQVEFDQLSDFFISFRF